MTWTDGCPIIVIRTEGLDFFLVLFSPEEITTSEVDISLRSNHNNYKGVCGCVCFGCLTGEGRSGVCALQS